MAHNLEIINGVASFAENGGSIITAAHKIKNKMDFKITSKLAAALFNVQGYADNYKATAIEKVIVGCKLATQVTRHDSIACVAKFDGAALISNETFEDIRVNVMFAVGMLYIVLVRNVMYGDVVRIVLHPDGSAEYVLDQIPF